MKKINIVTVFVLVLCLSNCNRNRGKGKGFLCLSVVSKNGIKVRKLPDLESPVVAVIGNGQIVRFIKKIESPVRLRHREGKWIKIQYKTITGWVLNFNLKEEIVYDVKKTLGNFSYWKVYSSSAKRDFIHMFDGNETMKAALFSFSYPDIWKKSGTIFDNQLDQKVLEIPGVRMLTGKQQYSNMVFLKKELLQQRESDDGSVIGYSKYEFLKLFTINGHKVIKFILGHFSQGGRINWVSDMYTIEYHIFSRSYYFLFSFRQTTLDFNEHKLFEKIIATFKFSHQ